MTNYPVGDFLIKIKNAAMARRKSVVVPSSKLILAVAEVLRKEKYLSEVKNSGKTLVSKLTYVKKAPLLIDIKLVSKPGKRVYMKADEIGGHRGLSFFLVSTPSGLMTSREAVKKNVGGEIIAEIQ